MAEQPDPLDLIAQGTVAAMLRGTPQDKDDWSKTIHALRAQTSATYDTSMASLLEAVLKLLKGDKPESIHPLLEDDDAACWEYIVDSITNPPNYTPMQQAIVDFLDAQTVEEKKRVVELQSELLLNTTADQLLIDLVEQYDDNPNVAMKIDANRALLQHCRIVGIEAAFTPLILQAQQIQNIQNDEQDELNRILDELDWPPLSLQDLPYRIDLCRQALELVERNQDPDLWGVLQGEIGDCLVQNPQGIKADNIEEAITHYQLALEVYTRDAFPEPWAGNQNNLANAYWSRIRGERADNIEEAITHYQLALEVRTRSAFPQEWAMTQNNLGAAYYDRIRGERADNIEEAITHYQLALEVRTRQTAPEDWAQTQNNLGNAYWSRVRGERADNIEEAITHYHLALEVRTRQNHPEVWADTQHNLATAYSDRVRGERADNIEEAITHYQLALEVRTRQTAPEDWADTQNNLANAYGARVHGEKANNIEKAIDHYHQVLDVFTRDAFPRQRAFVHNNLGKAYGNTIVGEHADNIRNAIAHFQRALEFQTLERFPSDHRKIQRNLGNLYFGESRWEEAIKTYRAAIAAGGSLLATANTEAGRHAEVGETTQLYANTAYCLLQSREYDEALVMLEHGKTQLLAEALALGDADLSKLTQEQQKQMQTVREGIRVLEAEMRLPLDTPARRDDRILADTLRQARADLNTLVHSIRNEHPDFMPQGLDLPGLLALVPPGGALVAPVITSQGAIVFVVPYGTSKLSSEHIVHLEKFTDDGLRTLLIGTEEAPGWLHEYVAYTMTEDLKAWKVAIARFTNELWTDFISHIHIRLVDLGIQRGASLLVMPSSGLQLLPLHAAWRVESGAKRYFIDDYEVIYTPSGYALDISRRRTDERKGLSALVPVLTPTPIQVSTLYLMLYQKLRRWRRCSRLSHYPTAKQRRTRLRQEPLGSPICISPVMGISPGAIQWPRGWCCTMTT